jgi:hypothetical protein
VVERRLCISARAYAETRQPEIAFDRRGKRGEILPRRKRHLDVRHVREVEIRARARDARRGERRVDRALDLRLRVSRRAAERPQPAHNGVLQRRDKTQRRRAAARRRRKIVAEHRQRIRENLRDDIRLDVRERRIQPRRKRVHLRLRERSARCSDWRWSRSQYFTTPDGMGKPHRRRRHDIRRHRRHLHTANRHPHKICDRHLRREELRGFRICGSGEKIGCRVRFVRVPGVELVRLSHVAL